MSKMGSHDPFGYLKHKLWPKEGQGIKLSIWLLIIKRWESPLFTYVQVACHISLKSSQWWLQIFFRTHFNWRSTHKIMGLQRFKSPNFDNFRTPNLGMSGQNDIWVHASWLGIENAIRGKVVASPSPSYGESCEFMFTRGSFMVQTFFQLCTN
jgi:hypothetical protein